jgi:hypothetical protein
MMLCTRRRHLVVGTAVQGERNFINGDDHNLHGSFRSKRSGTKRFRNLKVWIPLLPSHPACFLRTPPHCLKKNGTLARAHCCWISMTHSCANGRAPGPDSPPTITQSICRKSSAGSGPRSGSRERNLIRAPVCRSWSLFTRHSEPPPVILSAAKDLPPPPLARPALARQKCETINFVQSQ